MYLLTKCQATNKYMSCTSMCNFTFVLCGMCFSHTTICFISFGLCICYSYRYIALSLSISHQWEFVNHKTIVIFVCLCYFPSFFFITSKQNMAIDSQSVTIRIEIICYSWYLTLWQVLARCFWTQNFIKIYNLNV